MVEGLVWEARGRRELARTVLADVKLSKAMFRAKYRPIFETDGGASWKVCMKSLLSARDSCPHGLSTSPIQPRQSGCPFD